MNYASDTLRRARSLVVATLFTILVLPLGATQAFDERANSRRAIPPQNLTLTLLHFNDGESQLINAGRGELENFGGISRFATQTFILRRLAFREARTSVRNVGVLTLSSGDNFLAGPEFNASLNSGIFFDALALDLIGPDALALGNHEFDFGPDLLEAFIDANILPFEYLSANLDFSAEPGLQRLVDEGRIAKSTVVRKAGRRIGIVGATTEALPFISSPRNTLVNAVLPAVQGEIDRLLARGINIVVLISHLQDVDQDVALIGQLTGLDIAIAGGGDEILANPGDLLVPGDTIQRPYPIIATGADGAQVPVVTTGGNYKYVGRLIVEIDPDGEVISIDEESGPVRVAGAGNPDAVGENAIVDALVTQPVSAALEDLAQDIVGVSEVGLDGRRSNIRSVETNLGNLVADSQLWAARQFAADQGLTLPAVALTNGGGIRNDDIRGPGDISVLDTIDIVPFSNFVTIVPDIPRDQFKEILENAVSRLDPPAAPGGTGRFAQIGGFSYSYTRAGIPQVLDADGNVLVVGTRVLDVVLDDGTVIVDDGNVVAGDALSVATIDFLANGGDQYPFRGALFTRIGVTYQLALQIYIEQPLAGLISAADYPEGGEGRIVDLTP